MSLTNLVVGKNAHRSYVLGGILNQLFQFGELWRVVVTDELGDEDSVSVKTRSIRDVPYVPGEFRCQHRRTSYLPAR